MASNDGIASSPLDLLPPPPPSPPPSSLPFQTHFTTPHSPPFRPIPIEIYNHILHFAFDRHLPPLPPEDQLDKPPSLAPLRLPLTLVSKGLRELVLPFLYHHVTIRGEEDWIHLFDPEEGLLVGEGEEATRRTGWVKKLSFPRDHFPISSWTASKNQRGEWETRKPEPNMVPLDFSGLGKLEEVCVGNWGRDDVVRRDIEAAVDVEMAGGPYREQMRRTGHGSTPVVIRAWMRFYLRPIRSKGQISSLLDILSQTNPTSLHASLELLATKDHLSSNLKPLSIILHPPKFLRPEDVYEGGDSVEELSSRLNEYSDVFPASRFDLDPLLELLFETARKLLVKSVSSHGWTKDEAGWWTRD